MAWEHWVLIAVGTVVLAVAIYLVMFKVAANRDLKD